MHRMGAVLETEKGKPCPAGIHVSDVVGLHALY